MEDDGTLFCSDAASPTPPKRAKIARKGGLEFRARNTSMPKGPESFEELMEWPSFILKEVVADEDRKRRLFQVFRQGLSVTSAYSGMDAPRECLTQVAEAMRIGYEFWPHIEFLHSCDIAELPQKVLLWLAMNVDSAQSCVFADLEDRLPEDARDHLQNLAPPESADKETKAAAYLEMWAYLHDNRQACFHQFGTSFCLVHQRQCRVLGPATVPEAESQELDPISSSPGGGLVSSGPWNPFKLNLAGTVCKGWSYAGGRLQFSHSSERPHAIWSAERKARAEQNAEDAFVQECTLGYPVEEKLRDKLGDTHEIVMVKTGPESQGWPTTRPRSLTAGFNKKRWTWAGPSTDLAIQQEFDLLFSRSTELTGDVFFQADSDRVRKDIFLRLARRGGAADVGQELQFDKDLLLEVLPPGAVQRLIQYEQQMPSKQGIESGAFLCDVNQWPDQGCSTAGPWFPCQLTHATVVSMQKMRPAVGLEYLAAQGFHVFPKEGDRHVATALPVFKELSTEKVVSLSGNSMSLPAMTAWLLYVLSNIQPVERLTIQPELNMLVKGSSNEFASPDKMLGAAAAAAKSSGSPPSCSEPRKVQFADDDQDTQDLDT